MCNKLPYSNPRIDKCIRETIENINKKGRYKTLASCCGHDIYPMTIVVRDKITRIILEYYTQIQLEFKKRNRYYKKDDDGFYFILELNIKKGVN